MSNSTATFDPIVQSQASKEITANAYFDAVSPASSFGRRQSTSSGLTWGYYGATITVDGVEVGEARREEVQRLLVRMSDHDARPLLRRDLAR